MCRTSGGRARVRRTNVNMSSATMRHQGREYGGLQGWIACVALVLVTAFAIDPRTASAAGTYYVDNSGNAPCSSNGPGTEDHPFCTIGAALTRVGGPGTTILVKSGR